MNSRLWGKVTLLLSMLLISTVLFATVGLATPLPVINRSIYDGNGQLVITGSAFTQRKALAAALDDIFVNGHIHLFSDSSCTTELTAPLGNTSAVPEDTTRYVGNSGSYRLWSGQSCFIYVAGVYYTLFGDLPTTKAGMLDHSDALGSFPATYDGFVSHGVRREPGTMMWLDGTHNLMILSYDEYGVNTLEGNAIYHNGLVAQIYYTWDIWQQYFTTVKECYQPTDAYYNQRYPLDITPPVISQTVFYTLNPDFEGFVYTVTEEHQYSTWVEVWKYGESWASSDHYDSEWWFENYNRAAASLSNEEMLYKARICARDEYGNYAEPVYLEAPLSFFVIDKSICAGVYEVAKDEVAVRYAPYEQINGKATLNNMAHKGTRVQVVGSYTNSYGNEWYQLSDGNWVYSENLTRVGSMWGILRETLDNIKHPNVYYMNHQVLIAKGQSSDTTSVRSVKGSASFDPENGTAIAFATRSVAPEESTYGPDSGVPLHTITFDGNGGFVQEPEQQYYQGNVYGVFPEANRYGYTFAGWYTEAEDGDRVLPTDTCTQSMTLYAHWSINTYDTGECGEHLTWTLYEEGRLEFAGYGEMTSAPWQQAGYAVNVFEVSLPNGLTSICSGAFSGCENLPSIHFPGSLTSIGSSAFSGCTGLSGQLNLPEGITQVPSQAFYKCSSLTGVSLPNALTSIEYIAFKGCTGISEMTIPNSVQTLGEGCLPASLTKLTTPFVGASRDVASKTKEATLRYLFGSGSFEQYFNAPYGAPSGYAMNCTDPEALTTLVITDATRIPAYALYDVPQLQQVTLNEGIASIGDYAFYRCTGITQINLPGTLTSIGSSAFSNCTGLSGQLDLPVGLTVISFSAFSGCASLTGVTLPDTLVSIENSAFYGCDGITEMIIPNSVQTLGHGCLPTSLVKLTTPFIGSSREANKTREAVLRNLFTGAYSFNQPYNQGSTYNSDYANPEGLTTLIITDATQIPAYAFYDMPQLTQITLNEGITTIDLYAFYKCTGITQIDLPGSLNTISSSAFKSCTGLRGQLDLPVGLTVISDGAFYNCTSLTGVSLPGELTSIGNSAFSGCTGITEMTIPNSVQTMGMWCLPASLVKLTTPFVGTSREENGTQGSVLRYMFGGSYNTKWPYDQNAYNTTYYTDPEALTTLVITDATQIPHCAFYDMPQLQQITLNEGIASIGNYAFYQCTGITEIAIPDGVESIGRGAFPRSHETLRVVCGAYAQTWARENAYANRLTDQNAEYGYIASDHGDIEYDDGGIAPTCTEPGLSGAGHCTVCGDDLPAQELPIDESAHDWEEAIFELSADESTMTATHVCRRDPAHAETETAPVAFAVRVSAADDMDIEKVCSAVFENTAFGEQEQARRLPVLVLPEQLEEIDDEAFMGSSCEAVIVPEDCVAIGSLAFADCPKLIYIRIPAGTSVAGNAFEGCGDVTIDRAGDDPQGRQ